MTRVVLMCLGLLLIFPVFTGGGGFCAKAFGGGFSKGKTLGKQAEVGVLAGGWSLFYSKSYPAACRQAQGLLRSSHEAVRVEAGCLQARALWAMQRQTPRQQARKIWATLRRVSTLNSLQERLQIAEALQLSAQRDAIQEDKAIVILEGVLRRAYPGTSTAEAAIALSELYVRRENFVKAKRALDFASKQLQDPHFTSEISQEQLAPFLAAVKAGLGRLDYDQDPGRLEYEQARGYQRQGNMPLAIKAFRSISRKFAQTDYGPRSDLAIVDCLLSQKRTQLALQLLKKFIEKEPAGAYRGQAYLMYIDTLLEERYDVSRAAAAAKKASDSIVAGLATPAAKNSWRAAECDIYLRAGLLACLQNDNKAAAEAFSKAQKSGKLEPGQREGLRRLSSAMEAGMKLLPEDFYIAGRKNASGRGAPRLSGAEIILSSAVMYPLAGRLDKAELLLRRVLPSTYFPKTDENSQVVQRRVACKALHVSFALYLAGRMYSDRGEYDDARRLLGLSMKRYTKGTWHDATLYALGRAMEDQAAALEKAANVAAKEKPSKDQPSAKLSEKDEKRLARRRNRESQKIWQELLDRKEPSPFREYASFRNTMLVCEAGIPRDVQKALNRFVESYAQSSYAGEVYIRQIDLRLEQLFDIAAAEKMSEAALMWADEKASPFLAKQQEERNKAESKKKRTATTKPARQDKAKSELQAKIEKSKSPSPKEAVPLWTPRKPGLTEEQLQRSIYGAYLRCGLVDFLAKRYERANQRFEAARAFTPPAGYLAVRGTIPTGIDRMIRAARSGKPITPKEALEGDTKASLILQLADVHYTAGNYQRALGLCEIVLHAKDVELSAEQSSWALMRRGRCWFCLEGDARDPMAAMRDYMASVTRAPKAPWAYRGLFLSGNILFNSKKDVKGAVELWRRLLRQYPDSPEAHRVAYYIGVSYELSKQRTKALAAYNEFLRSFPNSPFVSLVRNYHLRRLEKRSGVQKHTRAKQQGV